MTTICSFNDPTELGPAMMSLKFTSREMPVLLLIESEVSLDEGVHKPGDRRYDLLHALAPLAAAQEQDLTF